MFSAEREIYFAYGSNMATERMQQRIRSARLIGPAQLDGYAWCCNKLGRDGSGKANLAVDSKSSVHGVLFEIKAKHLKKLDKIENGYKRIEVSVEHLGETKTVWSYQSELFTTHLPSLEYFSFIVSGIIQHQLPKAYLDTVRAEAGL